MKKTMFLIAFITGILFVTSCTTVSFNPEEDRTEELMRAYSAEWTFDQSLNITRDTRQSQCISFLFIIWFLLFNKFWKVR